MTKFSLPAGADADATPCTGVYPETDVGHVRLHMSDLTRAEAFNCDLLCLDVTQRGYPWAQFLSVGGYHHHLGVNVWVGAGAPLPPLEAVGLLPSLWCALTRIHGKSCTSACRKLA